MAITFAMGGTGSWWERKHPEYPKRNRYWELFRISYEGGSEYLEPSSYSVEFMYPEVLRSSDGTTTVSADPLTTQYRSMLYRHIREKEWEYLNRSKRARYFNIIKPTVNSIVAHALAGGITREGGDALTAFWDAADEDRLCSMDVVMSQALRKANTFGIYWLCVDRNPEGDNLPYVYGISPQDIFDWHTDDDGTIAWVKQFILTEQQRTYMQPHKSVERYRVWSKTEVIDYQVTSGAAAEIARRPNLLGVVPLVPVYSQRVTEWDFPFGTPVIADMAKLANDVFNKASLLDEILYKQTFSWLVVPDPNGKLDALQIGLNTAFGYDPGGQGGQPQFIAPDSDQARVLMETIGATLEQARAIVGIGRGRSEGSKAIASADALELEGEEKRSLLMDVAREGQAAEERVAALFQMYQGAMQGDKPYIAYPREFSVSPFEAEITQAVSMRGLGLPDPVMMQAKADIVRRKWQGVMPPDKLRELVASVEAATLDMPPKMEQSNDPNGTGTDKTRSGDQSQQSGEAPGPNTSRTERRQ